MKCSFYQFEETRLMRGLEGGGNEKEEWVFNACGARASLLLLEAIKLNIEFLLYREHSAHCKDQPVNAAKGNVALCCGNHTRHTLTMWYNVFFF